MTTDDNIFDVKRIRSVSKRRNELYSTLHVLEALINFKAIVKNHLKYQQPMVWETGSAHFTIQYVKNIFIGVIFQQFETVAAPAGCQGVN